MTRFAASTIILASFVGGLQGFTVTTNSGPSVTLRTRPLHASYMSDVPFYAQPIMEERTTRSVSRPEPDMKGPQEAAKAPAAKKAVGGIHKEGLLSPVVILSKQVLGEEELNKLRGKVIGIHSDVIAKFVDTHETAIGQQALKALFAIADKNKNGTIEEHELKEALLKLGFDLKEKQIKGVFERADADSNGAIDLEEWMREAPKTLRTNLIKLAKKNGGDMGLLA
jgi:hypothetical protein